MYTFVYRTFIKFILFLPGTGTFFDTFLLDKEKKRKLSTCFFRIMGISRSESGEFSFRFWGFSIDKTHSGLSCYHVPQKSGLSICVSMPSRAWVVTSVSSSVPTTIPSFNALSGLSCYWYGIQYFHDSVMFQCPLGLELLPLAYLQMSARFGVSMPSRAWVVTVQSTFCVLQRWFQCPLGLELLQQEYTIF